MVGGFIFPLHVRTFAVGKSHLAVGESIFSLHIRNNYCVFHKPNSLRISAKASSIG
jgi:hypothetical protein